MRTLIFMVFTLSASYQMETGHSIDGASEGNSSLTSDVERFDITKPPNEKRAYRGLKLKNDLRVVLVSEATTEKSAASMIVGIGGLNDFRDVPGIANLVGYTLMTGSLQYPYPGEFKSFLADHSGYMDLPITSAHEQEFSFSVSSAQLSVALDRFANMFVEPLMYHTSANLLKGPLNANTVEHARRVLIEAVRIAEVEKTVCKENHLYCHFFLGTKKTLFQHTESSLPEDRKMASLFEKVQMFHSFWYSSNLMTLAVFGRESLDELEKIVVPLFEKITNKDRKRLMYSHKTHPWGPEQLKNKIYMVPLNVDTRVLRLSFPVPDVSDKNRTSPDIYIGNLIADEGPTGLRSLLKKMGLAVDITVPYNYMAGISFFVVQVELTDKGVKRVDDVIHLLFQYIYLLRDRGIQKWIFDEQKEICEKVFTRYDSSGTDPLTYVELLSSAMQIHPMEDILSYNYFFDKWNSALIKNFVTYLRPDNMNAIIISQSSSKFADQSERFCGTRYGIKEIPDKLIQKWSTKETIPELRLPLVNDLLNRTFELYLYIPDENEPKNPYVIHKSAITEVWFKQDDKYQVPILYVTFELHSRLSRYNPGQRVLQQVFYDLFNTSLDGCLDSAALDGLDWKIDWRAINTRITLSGYNDRLPLLLEKLLSKLTSFTNQFDNEYHFKTVLKQHVQAYQIAFKDDHSFQLEYYTHYLRSSTGLTNDNMIKAGETLQYKDMKKFLSKIFRRIFVRGLIHGNCTKEKAMDIVNIIETAFQKSNGLLLPEILKARAVEIPQGSHFVHQVFNEKPDVYAYSSHFQLYTESPSVKNDVASYVCHHAIKKSCHRNLIKHLPKNEANEIRCALLETNGVRGITVSAVSAKDPRTMHRIMEKMLRQAIDELKGLSDQELEHFKTSVRSEKMDEPSNLNELSELYWPEISNRHFNFDRIKLELEQLHDLQKADLVAYLKEMLDASASRRRQLAVHIFPKSSSNLPSRANVPQGFPQLFHPENLPSDPLLYPQLLHIVSQFSTNQKKATRIENCEDFKNDLGLLPHNFLLTPSIEK